jgi:hypothetical protein
VKGMPKVEMFLTMVVFPLRSVSHRISIIT